MQHFLCKKAYSGSGSSIIYGKNGSTMTIKSGLVTGEIILLGENDSCELKGGVVKGIVGEKNYLSYDGTNNADNKVCKLDINLCFFS